MSYKALVLDIDGTLVSSKHEILSETKNALIDIQKKGITLILASGRPTFGMLQIAKELELDRYNGYILAYNGGKVIRMHDKQVIIHQSLDVDTIHTLYEESKLHQTGLIAYEEDTIITPKSNDYIALESRITGMMLKEVDDFKAYIKNTSVKCLMTGEPSYIETIEVKLRDKYKDNLSVYRSQPFFLELMPKGIDKGKQLLALLKELNLTKEEVIACGDGYNDISMVEVAGLGVAMANGCDEIKQLADYITASNDDNGIVEVIERFLINQF